MPSTAPATVFHAVAEPRRRRILELLAEGERPVNDLARSLRVRQPLASKQLRVLRDAGLVRVRERGRQRLYRLDPIALKPLHDWVTPFEEAWSRNLDRLDDLVRELHRKEQEET